MKLFDTSKLSPFYIREEDVQKLRTFLGWLEERTQEPEGVAHTYTEADDKPHSIEDARVYTMPQSARQRIERVAKRLDSTADRLFLLATITEHTKRGMVGQLKSEAALLREALQKLSVEESTAP